MSSPEKTPFHVVTGFLGSGKTRLLRSLLARRTEPIAVVVNEVGELGLDHHLLERVDDDGVLLLPGGCACCEIRGALTEALERMLALRPARIVLETTGLADPAPLLHAVATDPLLSASLRLAGVVAVADALRVEELAETQPEVRRQLDSCDRIALTKTDLVPDRAGAVRAWLEREAPGREVRPAPHGDVDPAWLLAEAGFARGDRADDGAGAWLRRLPDHHEHTGFTTHSVQHDEPVDVEVLQLWLRLVTHLDGPRLLRIKALARCAATGACFALHSAGDAVSPPQELAAAPAELRGAAVVVIERGMAAATMDRLIGSLWDALYARPWAGR